MKNNKYNYHRILFLIFFFTLTSIVQASQSVKLYAGMSTFVSCPNPPAGAIYQTAWASKHVSVSVTKDGTYGAKITVNSYFSGIAQVQCDYYWRWYVGNRQYTNHATTYYNVTCEAVNIRMNQSGPITLDSGKGVNLSVTLSPSTSFKPTVYWKSSNSNIAEVNQNGYVFARQPGAAVISASSNAGPDNASITINVNPVIVQKAELLPSKINIVTDESENLTLTTYPQYSKPNSISWYSDDPTIASISSTGRVYGKSSGITSVYCIVNGYITSNKVNVTVSKPKLNITADKISGLYKKGTKIALTSNKSGATIYYTLDGSNPNRNSSIYSSPISIDKNVVLKAYAVKDGCLDSDILSINYKVSSLNVSDTYPEKDSEIHRTNLVPTVIFNSDIHLSNNGKEISLKNNDNKSEIKGTVITTDKYLSFVPDKSLDEGNYTLTIPQQTIISVSQEENFAYSFSFKINERNSINDLCAGFQYSQVIKENCCLFAWGRNGAGQIGNGNTSDVQSPIKILDNIVYSEASSALSAAINTDGELYMWGHNNYGQLGNGSIKDSYKPIYIMRDVKKVVASCDRTLALTNNGYLYSWGANWWGQLGIGTKTQYSWKPNFVMDNIKDMSAMGSHTLIITNNDELYTCGYGKNGELCNGHYTTYISKPQKVMDNVKKAAALRDASIVLKNDGTLWAFGDNTYCQLGVQEDVQNTLKPLMILSDVKDIDSDCLTAAAIKNDNSLWLWGYNSHGEVGNGTKEKQKTPIKILENIKKVSVGEVHVMALTNDGELYGWGDNCCSEITKRTTDNSYILTPAKIPYFPAPTVSTSLHLENLNLKIGEQGVLLPYISPTNADYTQIEWNSSDSEIASVTEFGVVSGVGDGKATITCRIYNNETSYIEADCEVTVNENNSTILLDSTIKNGIDGWLLNLESFSKPLNQVWEWREYNNLYYLNGSAYLEGIPYDTNAWAISPVMELYNSAKSIYFEHAAKFQSTLKEMCSINIRLYGQKEWTKLNIPEWPSAGSWNFTNSGKIDVSTFAGKEIEIGLHYSSDYRGADTWEIRNIVIPGKITKKQQSSIESINYINNSQEPRYFNLQGVEVKSENIKQGIFIRVQNGKAEKIIL